MKNQIPSWYNWKAVFQTLQNSTDVYFLKYECSVNVDCGRGKGNSNFSENWKYSHIIQLLVVDIQEVRRPLFRSPDTVFFSVYIIYFMQAYIKCCVLSSIYMYIYIYTVLYPVYIYIYFIIFFGIFRDIIYEMIYWYLPALIIPNILAKYPSPTKRFPPVENIYTILCLPIGAHKE